MVDTSSGRKVKRPHLLPALNEADRQRLSLIPTGDTRDTGHAPAPVPIYNTDPKVQKRYLAQRRLRGVSDLVFGAGDMTNMAINAGIRDVASFAGGVVSEEMGRQMKEQGVI